jgi:hypothetical protein
MPAVIASATLWLLISLAFILDAVEAPRRLIQAGLALLCAQFVLLLVAGYSAECAGGPCVGTETITEATGVSGAIVTYVIPGLTAGFALYVVAYGVLRHRNAAKG